MEKAIKIASLITIVLFVAGLLLFSVNYIPAASDPLSPSYLGEDGLFACSLFGLFALFFAFISFIIDLALVIDGRKYKSSRPKSLATEI